MAAIITNTNKAQRALKIKIVWFGSALVFSILFLFVSDPTNIYVLLPAAFLFATVLIFAYVLQKREQGSIPYFELGMFYVLIVSIYSLYPVLSYVWGGQSYSIENDLRLYIAQPTPQEVGLIEWYYAIYLASFVCVYLVFRGKFLNRRIVIEKPSQSTAAIVLITFLAVKLFFIILGFYYNLDSQTYSESYLVVLGLPLILHQVFNNLTGITLTLNIIIMMLLVMDYKKRRSVIFAWIAFELMAVFVNLGSRTSLFILLLSFIILYHSIVKPPRIKIIAIEASLILMLFMVQGLLRGGTDVSINEISSKLLIRGGEFETLFGNAFDLYRIKEEGRIINLSLTELYLSDLLRPIPQQLLPFEKLNISLWYVQTYYSYVSELGGGFAFGTISESIVGMGWIDLIWRGGLLGLIFAKLHRYFSLNRRTFWKSAFYIWMLVMSYQAFRSTTFSLFGQFLYQFLIPMLMIKLGTNILKVRKNQ